MENHLSAPDESPVPSTTLRAYRRVGLGRKNLFAETPSAPARYFILNPVPQKHASTWKPILFRGDNPKYSPSSHAVARARRTAMWTSFRAELGDGVKEVLENKSRVKKRKSYERRVRFRRRFGLKEKPPKEELEEPQPVKGFVMTFTMKRAGWFGRTLKWEMGGKEYRWCGTRQFLPGWAKRCKGISHDLKLVDSDGTTVATFEKDRWASFRRSERSEGPPNKKKSFLGTLRIFQPGPRNDQIRGWEESRLTLTLCEKSKKDGKDKDTENMNLGGRQEGNLFEEAAVFTGWMAAEAEHRLRWKLIDLLEEIAEYFKE